MSGKVSFYHVPRAFKEIELFKDITEDEWSDPMWQLKNSIRSVDQLKKVIKLSEYQQKEIERVLSELDSQGKEALRITPYYASLMPEDPFHPVMMEGEKAEKRLDPVFWQSVPTPANLLFPDAGREAAMCEGTRSYGAAYQRYPNRVALFIAENTSCASYCVHCQRAKSLDSRTDVGIKKINRGIFYIGYNKNINEVLITGGDALMVSSKRLQYVLEELSRIEHLRVIRIATRIPVVLPMAITESILKMIKIAANKYTNGPDKYVYFMTHVNHYQEITEEMARAVRRINDHGFTIRNQTVFLNHVNDNFKTLAETFRRMLWIGIQPYYLLQCHKERGILHFVVPVQIGKIYMKHLQGWMSGITLPKYAANIEGGGGKVLLMPSGHDTLHTQSNIDAKISESYADILTWDNRKIEAYESLGRATQREFDDAENIMHKFIGRRGAFLPKMIIVDEHGRIIKTTNRTRLPSLKRLKKSLLLNYEIHAKDMPLSNPQDIEEELEMQFNKSAYSDRNGQLIHRTSSEMIIGK